MSWSHCGVDKQGRPIGYAHAGSCDHKDCNEELGRGLDQVCGRMHGEDEHSCDKYFCPKHLEWTLELEDECMNICEDCVVRLTTYSDYMLCVDDWVIRPIMQVDEDN